MRYFLTLSYDGTRYHGWQIQQNAVSVQQTLEQSLSRLLKAETRVVGAGRTDTGVHASRYIAHFDAAPIDNQPAFLYHLNCILPSDIAVSEVREVIPEAHARFDAVKREYRYYISRTKDPFRRDTVLYYSYPLDVEEMNRAAAAVMEYQDFTSFCRLHSDNKTNVCRIYESYWTRQGDLLIYTVVADRFLRNMVRALVGTMTDVGRGKTTVEEVRRIVELKSRGAAGASAPAHGLFLTDVVYPEEIYRTDNSNDL